MAKLSFELDAHQARATITVQGEITRGDVERFRRLVSKICDRFQEPEIPLAITAALDSPGGSYIEGIALGNLFWRNGYATLVRKDAECYSAAAFAFLGGAYLGVVGGWGADRTVEVGGTVGFHGFYSDSSETVALKDGIEQGKVLSMILADYATALRVDMLFILESLEKGPDELLTLRTVGQFRKLGIKVRGTARTSNLTDTGAVNAANYATGWKRPVSVVPGDGETLATITHLTPRECRRAILERLIQEESRRGPLMDMIRRAVTSNDRELEAVYSDLEALNSVPSLWLRDDDRIVQVTGFGYGALFYVTDCFIKASNEGTSDLALTVISVHFPSSFEVAHYSHSGDSLYEVQRLDTVLWTD